MRLRIKIILGVLAALLVTAHVLLWVVMSNMGPEILEESLSRHLGCHVATDRVKVSLLSQGIKIIHLRLSDSAHPDAEPFFTAKKVLLRLNLFALLAKRITIRNMIFLSPSLNIGRDPGGHWILPLHPISDEKHSDGAGAKRETPRTTQQNQTESQPPKRRPFFEIKFYKLDLRKGEILFADNTVSPPFWVRAKNIQAKGQFVTKTLLRFRLSGQVECKEPADFNVQGDVEIRDGKLSSNIVTQLDNLDITLLAPYYQKHCPAVITKGMLSLHSQILCKEDVLQNSLQTITFRDVKIHSWKEDFLNGTMFGIPNKDIADYFQNNSKEINLDFSISGPIDDLKNLQAQETFKALGVSAVDQWLRKGNSGELENPR